MTNREQAIADRLARATAGEWLLEGKINGIHLGERTVIHDEQGRAICQCSARNNVANSALIVNAPSDLAYYRDTVSGLRAQIEEAKRLLDCDAPNLAREALARRLGMNTDG